MDVSFIIVNYNTLKLTKECIDSVVEHTRKNSYEIILVDNDSTDGSKEYFPSVPNIRVILNPSNLGFGAANNVGANAATGKYLFFLNSDTILTEDVVSLFFNHFEHSGSSLGCCGCSLLDGELKPAISCGHFPSLMQEFLSIGFHKFIPQTFKKYWSTGYPYTDSQSTRVDYLIGADWFIPRDLFLRLGGFNKEFFMFYEETDLAYRLREAGYHSEILPEKAIIHYGGASTGGNFSSKRFRLYFKSKSNYFRRHKGILGVFLMKLLSICFYIVHPAYYKHLKNILSIIIKS